ncbi:MAG: RHS repeat protein [Sphingomonadales bacterium]|nr:RHS repeat protein [Sphingomonadales bacterium]
MTGVTYPEGNQLAYTYDARGNVTQETAIAKPGSGLANIIKTVGYDASCTQPVKCDKPNWTRDAASNQTDYTYDSTHGGVLTVTAPAATQAVSAHKHAIPMGRARPISRTVREALLLRARTNMC